MSRPIVVIPCCPSVIDGYTFDAVNEGRLRARSGRNKIVADEHPFPFGVPWRPEWNAKSAPIYRKLFRRFGEAARSARS